MTRPCGCNPGPGKFEGESAITYLAWCAVLDGGGELTTGGEGGDGPLTDWFGTFTAPDIAEEWKQSAEDYGFCRPCVEAASAPYGLAVWEDSQGFVGCAVFESQEEHDKARKAAEARDQEVAEQAEEANG